MSAARVVWATTLLLLAGAAPALGAGGEEGHGPSVAEYLWQAFNLALLVGIIVFAARKPVRSFFADRREQIQGDIESASDYLKDAEAQYAEWQRKLVDLDAELETIRGRARQRAQEDRDRILTEARASAERIKNDARAAVDQELRRAQEELRGEASDLAVELATRILTDEVSDSDRSRLVDEFIESVDSAPRDGGHS